MQQILKTHINKIFKKLLFENDDENYIFKGFEENALIVEYFKSYEIIYIFKKNFHSLIPTSSSYSEIIFQFDFVIGREWPEFDNFISYVSRAGDSNISQIYDVNGNLITNLNSNIKHNKEMNILRSVILKSKHVSLKQKIEITSALKKYNIVKNWDNIKFK